MDLNELQEQNTIYLIAFCDFLQHQREIQAALIDINQRKFYLTEFLDNEHYSNFESLIIQTHPQNDFVKFNLIISFPNLPTEKAKLSEIINEFEIPFNEKDKKLFQDKHYISEIQILLQSDIKHYLKETQMDGALKALFCGISQLKLTNDHTNQKKFTLSTFQLTNFMKLDKAALHALSILPKDFESLNKITSKNNKIIKKYLKRWQLKNRNFNRPSEQMQNINRVSLLKTVDKTTSLVKKNQLFYKQNSILRDPQLIQNRLKIVNCFISNGKLRDTIIQQFLKKIPDLDKLYAKFYKVHSEKKSHGANFIDCIKVYQLVINLKSFVQGFQQFLTTVQNPSDFDQLNQNYLIPFEQCLNDFEKLEVMIEKAVDLEKAYTGEYVINPNFSKELQQLSEQMKQSYKQIEKTKSKISDDIGLDINLVDSAQYTFLLEVKKKDGDAAFRNSSRKYRQISIKKGVICFTNEQLIADIAEYNELKSQYEDKQKVIVEKVLKIVATYYPAMEKASSLISEIDTLYAFAMVALSDPACPYTMPQINSTGDLILKQCRHPCLEVIQKGNCVANDCIMQVKNSKLHIITGPNMGGKSTYIRQIAITVLLSHIGCFVPCSSAEIPIIDAIITRVGASDCQLKGISTFMQEMLETSCMLQIASERSLIIIDELGRGTATNEGFGLAWGIAKYIVEKLRSYCLFATHFHEMTQMENSIPQVKNFHVSAIINDNQLTMLYKIKPGPVDRSYGLFVAEMLKFPETIIKNAQKKADELEKYEDFLTNRVINEEGLGNENSQQMICENTNNNNIESKMDIEECGFLDLAKNCNQAKKFRIINFVEQQKKKVNDDLTEEETKAFYRKLKKQIIKLMKENE